MIYISTNANAVIGSLFQKIANFDALAICQQQALYTVQAFRSRIHQQGKAADGSQIGTYSSEYMKVRTGNYGNSGTYKSGKNAGQPKNTGVYTKGVSKGLPRPQYNRSNDTTVILSLTRQMEQDLSVIPIANGYGVGYKNIFNREKAAWAEKTYQKKIFTLSTEEHDESLKIAEDGIMEALR